MTANAVASRGQGRNRWRTAYWSVVTLLLLTPLVAMQFTEEVDWTVSDFIFAGILFGAVGLTFEMAARKSGSTAYRAGVGLALAATFFLLWLGGAVGIIGSENDDANLLYFGVIGIAFAGSLLSSFKPRGMSVAMLLAAIATLTIGVLALTFGWGSTDPSYPRDIIGLTGGFTALWLCSSWSFGRAAMEPR